MAGAVRGLDLQQLHVDRALSNLSIAYKPQKFIAEELFPPFPCDNRSNVYFVESDDQFRDEDDVSRPGDTPGEIEWTEANTPFKCDSHRRQKFISDDEWSSADQAIRLETAAVHQLTEQTKVRKESNAVRMLEAAVTATTLTKRTAGSGGVKYLEDTSLDPVAYFDSEKEVIALKIGQVPNTLMLSRPVFRKLRNHPAVVGRVTGAATLSDSRVTLDQLKNLFEVDRILIGEAIRITSQEGKTAVKTFIWGYYALLAYCESPGIRALTFGQTFQWDWLKQKTGLSAVAADVGAPGRFIKRIRDEIRDGDIIRSYDYYQQQLIVPSAGLLYDFTPAG